MSAKRRIAAALCGTPRPIALPSPLRSPKVIGNRDPPPRENCVRNFLDRLHHALESSDVAVDGRCHCNRRPVQQRSSSPFGRLFIGSIELARPYPSRLFAGAFSACILIRKSESKHGSRSSLCPNCRCRNPFGAWSTWGCTPIGGPMPVAGRPLSFLLPPHSVIVTSGTQR